MEVNYGNPITIDKKTKLTHENEQIIYKQLEDAWDKLDKELDPNFHYVAKWYNTQLMDISLNYGH